MSHLLCVAASIGRVSMCPAKGVAAMAQPTVDTTETADPTGGPVQPNDTAHGAGARRNGLSQATGSARVAGAAAMAAVTGAIRGRIQGGYPPQPVSPAPTGRPEQPISP